MADGTQLAGGKPFEVPRALDALAGPKVHADRPPGDWVGPALSGLCLVHCIGTAVVLPLLPGALGSLSEDPRVELAFLAFAIGSGAFVLRRNLRTAPRWAIALAILGALVALGGIFVDLHGLTIGGLVAMAIAQTATVLLRPRCTDPSHHHDGAGGAT